MEELVRPYLSGYQVALYSPFGLIKQLSYILTFWLGLSQQGALEGARGQKVSAALHSMRQMPYNGHVSRRLAFKLKGPKS